MLRDSGPSVQAPMSTLHYSTVTSVIVQVADSVTESSSGNLSWGPLKQVAPSPSRQAGQTDLRQAALCPLSCSPLLSTPLLTTPCSLLLLGSSVRLHPYCIFHSDWLFVLSAFDQVVF